MLVELDEHSLKINQPLNLSIKLKNHQLSNIYAMLKMEETGKVIRLLPYHDCGYTNLYFGDCYNNYKEFEFETNYGLLTDMVGSGKTYTILGLIATKIETNKLNIVKSLNNINIMKYNDDSKTCKANLIMVPHTILKQWAKIFESNSKMKIMTISKKMDITNITKKCFMKPDIITNEQNNNNNNNVDESEDESEENNTPIINNTNTVETLNNKLYEHLNEYDVIICSSSFIKDYMEITNQITYSRVIIDECNMIRLQKNIRWRSNFTWYITATPSGMYYITNNQMKNITTCYHGYGLGSNELMSILSVKNNDDYVIQMMNLPEIRSYVLKCSEPKQMKMIKEYLPRDVIDMLNAGDIEGAKQKLNCNIETTGSFIEILKLQLEKDLHNLNERLKYHNNVITNDEAQHKKTITELENKIKSAETKYKSIKERIEQMENDSCVICMEEYKDKETIVLFKCCNQILCLICMDHIDKCPFCRIKYDKNGIQFITKKNNYVANNDKKIEDKENKISKLKALMSILGGKKDGKILIFASYDNSLSIIEKELQKNKITYDMLKGTGAHIMNTIKKFEQGNINVLLLNAHYCGSGLNLQSATDVIIYHELPTELETQVIGRAQRMGRSTNLNVYYLQYENEKININNPNLTLDLNLKNDIEKMDKNLGLKIENNMDIIDV